MVASLQIHPGEGDSRCTNARRVQEQETTAECRGREFESTRRWHWRRWLQVAVYGAFCTARQTDLKEVCLGLDHGFSGGSHELEPQHFGGQALHEPMGGIHRGP